MSSSTNGFRHLIYGAINCWHSGIDIEIVIVGYNINTYCQFEVLRI